MFRFFGERKSSNTSQITLEREAKVKQLQRNRRAVKHSSEQDAKRPCVWDFEGRRSRRAGH